jgi:hypothetical protein
MKHLVGKKMSKKVPFMGDKVEVSRLSVKEVMEVQAIVKKSQAAKDENAQIGLLRDVIRIAVIGADEISDDEFDGFPIAELTELVDEILSYSGLSGNDKTGK